MEGPPFLVEAWERPVEEKSPLPFPVEGVGTGPMHDKCCLCWLEIAVNCCIACFFNTSITDALNTGNTEHGRPSAKRQKGKNAAAA